MLPLILIVWCLISVVAAFLIGPAIRQGMDGFKDKDAGAGGQLAHRQASATEGELRTLFPRVIRH